MYDRRLRDIVRYPNGEKIGDFHIPTDSTTTAPSTARYLHDPDLQDARARWPFVTMWDNHEFSWLGWQGIKFNGELRPAQTRKVAANQAWYEYQPARVAQPRGIASIASSRRRSSTRRSTRFDDDGLGQEPNNLAAIDSLTGYRALRWGRTSTYHHRPAQLSLAGAARPPGGRRVLGARLPRLRAGGGDGDPRRRTRVRRRHVRPRTIRYGDADVPNFRARRAAADDPRRRQKRWFLERLGARRDVEDLGQHARHARLARRSAEPAGRPRREPWPGAGYAGFGGGDHSAAYVERAEIYDFVAKRADRRIRDVAGDRHSFWAGSPRRRCRPAAFEPVGIAFVTGSISAPGLVEASEHGFRSPTTRCGRCTSSTVPDAAKPRAHGEPAAAARRARVPRLRRARRPRPRARACRNPDNAPHLSFVDMGGHGYAIVRARRGAMRVNSSASRVRSGATSRETAGRSAIASSTRARCGSPASLLDAGPRDEGDVGLSA